MADDFLSRQIAAITNWLRIFHSPFDAVELRALGVYGRRAVCGVFDSPDMLAARAAELDGAGATGTYFTLNPLRPDLAGSTASARAADVIERHWLPLDIDPYRPKDCSSTDAELACAWAVLDRCRATLEGAGLAGAVIGHSGNGWHLCYPILLPNDPPAQDLVKAILKGLAARCGDQLTNEEQEQLKALTALEVPKAKVEQDVHDAPRIWKLYGTRARKGTSTEDRPHRWARLIEGEPWRGSVGVANVAALHELLQRWQFADDSRRGRPQTDAGTYAAAALRQEEEAVKAAAVGERNNQLNRSAFNLGQLVGSKALGLAEVEAALLAAAVFSGLSEAESMATIRSGLESGIQHPRDQGRSAVPAYGVSSSASSPEEPIMIHLADVTPQPVNWLWPGWMPRGHLVILDGDPGLGKSCLTLELAARLSVGAALPPLSGPDLGRGPMATLLLGAEDSLKHTIRPRLDAMGADCALIHSYDGVKTGEDERPVILPGDLERIANFIIEHRVGFVVVDPLMAYLGCVYDAHKD
jgi:hypothetical protein